MKEGRTDGQNRSDCYSGLHCEQCRRAVKTNHVEFNKGLYDFLFTYCRGVPEVPMHKLGN